MPAQRCVKASQTAEMLETPRRLGKGRWAVPMRDWARCRTEIRVDTLRFAHPTMRSISVMPAQAGIQNVLRTYATKQMTAANFLQVANKLPGGIPPAVTDVIQVKFPVHASSTGHTSASTRNALAATGQPA